MLVGGFTMNIAWWPLWINFTILKFWSAWCNIKIMSIESLDILNISGWILYFGLSICYSTRSIWLSNGSILKLNHEVQSTELFSCTAFSDWIINRVKSHWKNVSWSLKYMILINLNKEGVSRAPSSNRQYG